MSRFNKYFCVICDYHHHFQFYYPATETLVPLCRHKRVKLSFYSHSISHVLHTRCSVLMCACAGAHEHNHINVSVCVAFSRALRSQTVIYWEKWWKAVGRLFLLAVVSLFPPQLKLLNGLDTGMCSVILRKHMRPEATTALASMCVS